MSISEQEMKSRIPELGLDERLNDAGAQNAFRSFANNFGLRVSDEGKLPNSILNTPVFFGFVDGFNGLQVMLYFNCLEYGGIKLYKHFKMMGTHQVYQDVCAGRDGADVTYARAYEFGREAAKARNAGQTVEKSS